MLLILTLSLLNMVVGSTPTFLQEVSDADRSNASFLQFAGGKLQSLANLPSINSTFKCQFISADKLRYYSLLSLD
jgi:hypothetical protein